ncbi:hypothetical protein H6G26_30950 [Nostoc sp. FACHB-888]|nr:hypothetical protein [Nostoc sp. FACHB-888]
MKALNFWYSRIMANYLMGLGNSSGAIAFKSEGRNPKIQETMIIRVTKVPVYSACLQFRKSCTIIRLSVKS